MQTKESFSQQMNDFHKVISACLKKMDGRTFWPGSGGQLAASYIEIDALDILRKVVAAKEKGVGAKQLFRSPTQIRYLLVGNYIVGLKVLIRDKKITLTRRNRNLAFTVAIWKESG